MLPLGPDWWLDSNTNANRYDCSRNSSASEYEIQHQPRLHNIMSGAQPERADRGQTIMTLWIIVRSPLMHAGRLPTDEKTLLYLTNPNALKIHQHSQNNHVVGYSGNCTCKGDRLGSCTIPHDPAVGEPCVVKWAAQVSTTKMNWIAVAIINMGEATTTVWSRISEFWPPSNYSFATDYDIFDI